MASGGKRKSTTEGEAVYARLCGQVRKLRTKHRWTLAQLSAASGVSRSMLSQIERNQANPTLGVAYRIAQAFGLSLNDLIEQPRAKNTISVVHASDRSNVFRSDSDCRIRTLSPLNLEKDVEFYELVLFPGRSLRSAPHFEGTREFISVQEGTVRVVAGEETCDLETGDSAFYLADVVHAIENTSRKKAVVFLADLYSGEK